MTANYGERITGRPPDEDTTIPCTSQPVVADAPTRIAAAVPTVNYAAGPMPDGDPTIPSTSQTDVADVPTGIADVVPTVNDTTTSGERTSTAEAYGENITREPSKTPIIETVDDDTATADNDDDAESSPV